MEDLSPCINFLIFSMNMSTIFGMEPAKQTSLSSRKHQLLNISLLPFSNSYYDAEEKKGGGGRETWIHLPGAMTSFCFWYLSKHLPISVRLPVGMGEVDLGVVRRREMVDGWKAAIMVAGSREVLIIATHHNLGGITPVCVRIINEPLSNALSDAWALSTRSFMVCTIFSSRECQLRNTS